MLVKKLQDIGQKINEKQKMYADLAIQSARASMNSMSSGKDANTDAFMVNGTTIEDNYAN